MATVEDVTALGLLTRRGFLEPKLCARIRAEAATAAAEQAIVVRRGERVLELGTRRSVRVELADATRELVEERLRALMPEVAEHYGVELSEVQAPQLLAYRPGDYFKAHQDSGTAADLPDFIARRRVSAVLFLNGESPRPADGAYGGGALRFFKLDPNPTWETARTALSGEEGLLVTFPADLFHEVAPVTHGERFTLAAWFE
jgi:SM-20-related protein